MQLCMNVRHIEQLDDIVFHCLLNEIIQPSQLALLVLFIDTLLISAQVPKHTASVFIHCSVNSTGVVSGLWKL